MACGGCPLSHPSAQPLLALHGVRLLGYVGSAGVAGLYALPVAEVEEHLLDAEALGWVRRSSFAGDVRWSMTDRGRAEDERLLAAELDATGARAMVDTAYEAFLPLNDRLGELMTQWQLRPVPGDALAANDHRDARYDDDVVRRLVRLRDALAEVTDVLGAVLARLTVHQARFDQALDRVRAGRNAWVDAPDVPSLNLVWIQLHEDLLATLGLARGG